MPETINRGNQIEVKDTPLFDYQAEAGRFLGEYYVYFEKHENLKNFYEETVLEFKNQKNNTEIKYNHHKSEFSGNGKKVSKGEIIASRHFGFSFDTQNLGTSFEEKTVSKNYNYFNLRDIYLNKINQKLVALLYEENKNKDSMKAEAYKATFERINRLDNTEEKQLGFFAEQLMIATFERLSIDRKDELGIDIYPANAYQDVNDKIDFVISSKNKSRGIGTTIGIQFTINQSAKEHKQEQISKAKFRNYEVDDILLVIMDQKFLAKAKKDWEDNGKDIAGPWKYLPKDVREKILQSVLKSLVEEKVIDSIVKKELV